MNVITVIIVIFDKGKGERIMILFEKNDSGTCKRDAVASIGFVLPRRRAEVAKGRRPWNPRRTGGRVW